MQGKKKHTKYIKATNDSDQLLRALNNIIKQGLCDEYKSVLHSADAFIMLNLHTILSVETRLCFLQREQDSISD